MSPSISSSGNLIQAKNYAVRIVRTIPAAVFGTGSDVAGMAMRSTKGSLLDKTKAGFKALEKYTIGGKFKKELSLKSFKLSMQAGMRQASIKGKSKLSGFSKGLMKRMPLIGAGMIIATEIPNICKTITKKGIGEGCKDILKTSTSLVGGAGFAAIGTALFPGIGSMVGWFAGEALTRKLVGKTYSQKMAEQKMG